MATHRHAASMSSLNLNLPSDFVPSSQQPYRKMTGSSPSLVPPELPSKQQPPTTRSRPHSPLRNGFIPDTSTGISIGSGQSDPGSRSGSDEEDDDEDDDDDDDDEDRDFARGSGRWPRPQQQQRQQQQPSTRSPSPTPSVVSQLAASFAQRVGSLISAPNTPSFPLTDAELEAEAERERDRSRKEAERILTREAKERKLVEERVLAMMETAKALPPPPSTTSRGGDKDGKGTGPPSPSPSTGSNQSWWTAAKNRLTPSKDGKEKEPLTPAQLIIQEAKAREKDTKKGTLKGKEKEASLSSSSVVDWSAQGADSNLNIPLVPPLRRPVPSSPGSPTPSRPSLSNMAPNLTPSPMRSLDNVSSSPSREAPPMYAQFNSQGTLDVPGTLLVIAKRFEKLEKWTVGHVRALEERMSDVERWLVEKEQEKEKNGESGGARTTAPDNSLAEVNDLRNEVAELQSRFGELGREMAKIATSPSNLSSGPSKSVPPTTSAVSQTQSMIGITSSTLPALPNTSSLSSSTITMTPRQNRPMSSTALESTSPPMSSSKGSSSSGTRLPYPTGDYTSPEPSSGLPLQSSPPNSLKSRPISGLPTIPTGTGLGITYPSSAPYSSTTFAGSSSSLTGSASRTTSPRPVLSANSQGYTSATAIGAAVRATSPVLQPPSFGRGNDRQASASPTPTSSRKRYTVALGGPIVAPSDATVSQQMRDLQKIQTTQPLSISRPSSAAGGGTSPYVASPSSLYTPMRRATNGGKEESDVNGGEGGGGGGAEDDDDDDDDEKKYEDETIGKSAAARWAATSSSSSSSPGNSSSRIRAQSVYGSMSSSTGGNGMTGSMAYFNTANVTTRGTPSRSRSTDRFGASEAGTGKFVDPLVLRRQESNNQAGGKVAMPKPVGKVPIGQLVAFFDKDKK